MATEVLIKIKASAFAPGGKLEGEPLTTKILVGKTPLESVSYLKTNQVYDRHNLRNTCRQLRVGVNPLLIKQKYLLAATAGALRLDLISFMENDLIEVQSPPGTVLTPDALSALPQL